MLSPEQIGRELERELAPLIMKCGQTMTDTFELYYHKNNPAARSMEMHFSYLDNYQGTATKRTIVFVLPRVWGPKWKDALDEVKAWLTLRACAVKKPSISLEDISAAADSRRANSWVHRC